MKKMICKILSAIMILTSVTAISVSADEAVPTTSTVLVNGNNIKFDSYNINGNNYFKLRDLAYVLNTTEKQFSIGYNEVLNTVSLTSRQPYIAVGGEMEIGDGDNVQTEPTSSTILKNGEVVQLQAYLIDDSNYFKLLRLPTSSTAAFPSKSTRVWPTTPRTPPSRLWNSGRRSTARTP